jgi:hypothetical protein
MMTARIAAIPSAWAIAREMIIGLIIVWVIARAMTMTAIIGVVVLAMNA